MHHHRLHVLGTLFLLLAVAALPAAAHPLPRPSGPRAVALANGIQSVSTGASGLGGGSYAALSENGRFVVFESFASDLVPGQVDDSWDVIAHDLSRQEKARISTSFEGQAVYNPGDYTSPPSVSRDGRYIAFMSRSDSLVPNDGNGVPDIFLHDRARETMLISVGMDGEAANGASFTPAVSGDGRYVAFQSMASNLAANDNNEAMDVFLRDTETNSTWPVTTTSTGDQGSEFREYGFPSVSISGDGRFVAFSYQYLPVDNQPSLLGPSVYLYDHEARATTWVAYGSTPTISTNGQMLLFVTSEPLIPEDDNNTSDLYLLDLAAQTYERISLPRTSMEAAEQDITSPADISDDGRYVVFESNAALVRGVSEGTANIYLRDRLGRTTFLVSRAVDGSPADGESHYPAISGDGRTVAFNSFASNLIEADTNAAGDVFVFNRIDPGLFFDNVEYYLPLLHNMLEEAQQP